MILGKWEDSTSGSVVALAVFVVVVIRLCSLSCQFHCASVCMLSCLCIQYSWTMKSQRPGKVCGTNWCLVPGPWWFLAEISQNQEPKLWGFKVPGSYEIVNVLCMNTQPISSIWSTKRSWFCQVNFFWGEVCSSAWRLLHGDHDELWYRFPRWLLYGLFVWILLSRHQGSRKPSWWCQWSLGKTS